MPQRTELTVHGRRYRLVPWSAVLSLGPDDVARIVAELDGDGALGPLARVLSIEPASAPSVAAALVRAFERGDLVALDESDDYPGLSPVIPGSYALDWDELPSLSDLAPRYDLVEPPPPAIVPTDHLVTEIVVDGYAEGALVLRWGGMRPRTDGTVATARAALRTALWTARGLWVAVAGHTDGKGTDANNVQLASERATSMHLFASGQLEAWAQHAAAHGSATDVACALVACHRILGLGVASIDDAPRRDAALSAVRRHAELPAAGPISVGDWLAIAELYDLDLAALLLTDRAGLADLRRTITWCDPSILPVGERHPVPRNELTDLAGPEAPAHRRTSLLVFSSNAQANPALSSEGVACYDGRYVRTTLRVPGEAVVDILVRTRPGAPIPAGRVWIDCGSLGASPHIAGADGHVRFTTLVGDRVEVVAASFAVGVGAMIEAGVEVV